MIDEPVAIVPKLLSFLANSIVKNSIVALPAELTVICTPVSTSEDAFAELFPAYTSYVPAVTTDQVTFSPLSVALLYAYFDEPL